MKVFLLFLVIATALYSTTAEDLEGNANLNIIIQNKHQHRLEFENAAIAKIRIVPKINVCFVFNL